MNNAYCKKCGLRANTKCPHHRNIFAQRRDWATTMIETMISAKRITPESAATGGLVEHSVRFRTYTPTQEEAMADVLETLKDALPKANLTVAACLHDWELLPGMKCEVGQGCVGPTNDDLPEDPYPQAN